MRHKNVLACTPFVCLLSRTFLYSFNVHGDLEEVDLCRVAGPVHERHIDLGEGAPVLTQALVDGRLADREALLDELPVQTRAGDSLLARRAQPPFG